MASPSDPLTFASLGLAEPVLRAVFDVGYESPSPIQADSIPVLLQGQDLVGQAQTGTGKTAAFALPLLSRIDLARRQPQVLVLAPTRELAIQVSESFQKYARYLPGFHVLPVYGGQSLAAQLRPLQRGVHVVVGTPGRIMDHLRRGTLSLDSLSALVLDEADEMLNMGFIEDVEWILEQTPTERQVALFSATMPPPILKIAKRHLRDPKQIKTQAKTTTVEAITQRYCQVSGANKMDTLTRILETEEFNAVIVFVRTKTATVEVAEKLEARGYAAAPLNGDMNQAMRESTVERLKKNALDIVVATDVAARGLDVERISHVINYDIPYDTEAYVHRIGRTGRAGRAGQAILLVEPRERRMLQAIERATRQPITPMYPPTARAVADRRIDRFKQMLGETIETQDLGFFESLIDAYQQESNRSLPQIAAALAYITQKERPLTVEEAPTPPRQSRSSPPKAQRGESAAGKAEGKARREAPPRQRERDGSSEQTASLRYRLEVGRDHGAQPKNIIGALANEAGLDSRYINQLEIHDTYSMVDLPKGMPKEIFQHLRNVRVCGKKLNLSRADAKAEPPPPAGRERPQRAAKPSPKRPAKPKTRTR